MKELRAETQYGHECVYLSVEHWENRAFLFGEKFALVYDPDIDQHGGTLHCGQIESRKTYGPGRIFRCLCCGKFCHDTYCCTECEQLNDWYVAEWAALGEPQ